MNYLAHIFIAEYTSTSLTGNFLGDFVKGPVDKSDLPAKLQVGIKLHRKVDSFTDNHDIFKRSKRRISTKRRRYAGIIIDLAFDYYLSKHWYEFADAARGKLITSFYDQLKSDWHFLPVHCQNLASHMIESDWLAQYESMEGIDRSLNGLSRRIQKRFGRDNPLDQSVSEITKNYAELEKDFRLFFPQLLAYVR